MAYNDNIPQPTDLVSNSQPQILANFAAIDSGTTGTGIGFSRNHVTMTDTTNGGLHHRVDYFKSVSTPTITGANFVSSLYARNISSIPELFYINSDSDGRTAIWRGGTGTGLISNVTGGDQSSGSLSFPNGMILKWGYVSSITSGTQVAFTSAFTNACFTVIATPLLSGVSSRVFFIKSNSINTSGFTPLTDSSSMGLTYLAIGF